MAAFFATWRMAPATVAGMAPARLLPAWPAAIQPWAVAALSLLWLGCTAGLRPLMLPDEGRYAGVAWEMLRSGDWLTPTLDGLPFFHKPPLFYWITAAALRVLGHGEWAARSAAVLGGWLAAMSVYVFARRWLDEHRARRVLLVLLVQPLFFLGSQYANLDMLVAGCISATTVLLAHAALLAERGQPLRAPLAAAFAMAALGLLAKGLIGVVIPALVVLGWLAARRQWRVLRAMLWWPGALLFMVLAAPWFVAMQLRFAGFFDYFFIVQHVRRFAGGGFNNVRPFWFFPAVLLLLSLPWLPWLLRGLARPSSSSGSSGAGSSRGGNSGNSGNNGNSAEGPIRLLMGVWLCTVVLFFSLPQSKLVGYVLPALPPLAYLVAQGLPRRAAGHRPVPQWWWLSAAVSALVGVAVVAVLTLHPKRSSRPLARVLAAQRAPQEPVILLDGELYDLAFYARLQQPVQLVDDWTDPGIPHGDDWRKEIADAARFAPALAGAVLTQPSALAAAACRAPVSWIAGSAAAAAAHPWLWTMPVAYRGPELLLWRVDAAAPALRGQPGCAPAG